MTRVYEIKEEKLFVKRKCVIFKDAITNTFITQRNNNDIFECRSI